MNVSILTVFPDLYTTFLKTSLLGRAQENKLINFDLVSYFSFVASKQRIDAPTFGPGAGMLIKPEVVEKAVGQQQQRFGDAYKVFFSPQGKKLEQRLMKKIAQKSFEKKHLMLVTSRYEGMDARAEAEYADEVVSLGDFVIMGGDLPAQVLLEGVARLWPSVVGKQESIEKESFSGPFVDYPEYTEPVEWHDRIVPEVVRSGNHGKINEWRQERAAEKSVMQHFDWLRSYPMDEKEKKVAKKFIPNHYACLMHDQVLLPNDRVGTSSITSLDIHDIARSVATYALKNYFIVSPLEDQKRIAEKLLSFWKTDVGIEYNPSRHKAVGTVILKDSLKESIRAIEEKEGVKPLVIATSARSVSNVPTITYWDQTKIFQQKRPVLFVFGTARGLASEVFDLCDYTLIPVYGFSDFNHLSVRSAVAIILDRWLGINPRDSERL